MVSLPLSVVIPVNQDRGVLTLLSQLQQDQVLSWGEIIVVANDTSEELKEEIRARLSLIAEARLIEVSERGIALARNLGIQGSKRKWLLFLDSDCSLSGNYGSAILQLLKIVASSIEIFRGPVTFLPRNSLFSHLNCKMRNKSYGLNRAAFYAPNLIVNRKAFEEFGLMSTEMRYGVDTEWGRRAELFGAWLRFVDELEIMHTDDQSPYKTLRTWHNYGIGRAYREKRHYLLGGYSRKQLAKSLLAASNLFDLKEGLSYNFFIVFHYMVRTTGVIRGLFRSWRSLEPAQLAALHNKIGEYKNRRSMKKYLLLDVGGVIILDSKPKVIQSFSKNNGFEISDIYELLKIYRQERMLGKDFDVRTFLSAKGINWISRSQLTNLLDSMWDTEKPNKQFIEIISKLKKQMNFEVVLVTNNYKELLEILEKKGVRKFWDKVINSSEIGLAKPDPEFFKATLAILQARPENCLFVDDNPKNISGAAREGIAGVVYCDNISLSVKIRSYFAQLS